MCFPGIFVTFAANSLPVGAPGNKRQGAKAKYVKVLLVEDNERLVGFIRSGLASAGFVTDVTERVEDALAATATARYDAIVLDLGLPDGDGMRVVQGVRNRGGGTPILILTSRDGLRDRVDSLNGGADDFLLKPFAMEELVARLKALLRRPGHALGVVLNVGNLAFDTIAREVRIGDRPVMLSRRELELLELLLRRAGRVVPREAIEESVYGFDDDISSNSLEVLVHRLRKRLTAEQADIKIHTLRGVGYLLAEGAL